MEDELFSDASTKVQLSTGISDECLADILRPESFDWAEDAEESLSGASTNAQSSTEIPDGCLAKFLYPKSFDGKDKTVDDMPASISSKMTGCLSHSTVPSNGDNMSLTVNTASTRNEAKSYSESSEAEAEVEQEFAWREYSVRSDAGFHHFDWPGNPVYKYSWTPPAASLMYILSNPKMPQPGDELRLQSILSRATAHIDPVLAYVEGAWTGLQAKGRELINFATGQACKFYTPHGQWVDDRRKKDDLLTIDDGDVLAYMSPNLAAGNGFAEVCRLRFRSKWAMARDARLSAAQSNSGNLYRAKMSSRAYRPSPLKHSIFLADQAPENEVPKQ